MLVVFECSVYKDNISLREYNQAPSSHRLERNRKESFYLWRVSRHPLDLRSDRGKQLRRRLLTWSGGQQAPLRPATIASTHLGGVCILATLLGVGSRADQASNVRDGQDQQHRAESDHRPDHTSLGHSETAVARARRRSRGRLGRSRLGRGLGFGFLLQLVQSRVGGRDLLTLGRQPAVDALSVDVGGGEVGRGYEGQIGTLTISTISAVPP